MGIYLSNMEMPKGCGCCSMASHCEFLLRKIEQTDDELWIPLNYRLDDCPLVEIPVPHGNLIDADELTRWMQRSSENPYLMWSEAKVYRNIIIEIKNARTFVEAEGEG